MQTYDILMLLVLVAAAMFGFWKGMAWQIASLASLVVSFFVAKKFAPQLAPMISSHEPWNMSVAMLAIYIGTSFVIWMAFRLVAGVIDQVKLQSFDRQMGLLFGLAKGALFCVAITFFAVTILPQAQKEMILASQTGEYIVVALDKTQSIVPPEIHEVIHPYVERIEQRLDPNYQNPSGTDVQSLWPRSAEATLPDPSSLWGTQSSDNNAQPTTTPPSDAAPSNWSQPTQPQTADRPSENRNLGNAY